MSISRTFILSTVVIGVSFAQTYVPINSIKQRTIGQDSIRPGERVAGRVTVANQFRNTSYIQDGTGGIAVFNSAFRNGVQVGDSVEFLSGMLTEFQPISGQPGTGLTQISGASVVFQVVPGQRQEPTPLPASIQSIGEALEGMLVRVRNVQFVETGVFQGDRNYTVRDPLGNQLQVRIDGATDIARNALSIPSGRIDVIGVISQFRGTYQLLPRFASDLGLTVAVDTIPKNQTLDITTWNLLWFGSTDTTLGVRDKQRQFNSIRMALDSMSSDIYALQEVVTQHILDSLASTVQGSYLGYLAPIEQQQKMAYLVSRASVNVVETGLAVNGGSQAWASGRFPLRMTARCTVEGVEKRIVIFNIHAKATGDSTTAQDDWQRRKTDAETFYDYLNTFYPNDPVIVLGDFNDDVTSSVVEPNATPYSVFVQDTVNWRVLTKPLSEQGLRSYIGSSINADMLDHMIVSNELAPAIHRTYLESPTAFLSSYTSTVSDHLPVTVRIRLRDVITSVYDHNKDNIGYSVQLGPNPADDKAFIELHVSQPEHVKVILTDIIGRNRQLLLNEQLPAQIRLIPIECSTLSPGVYLVHVESTSTRCTLPLIVIH